MGMLVSGRSLALDVRDRNSDVNFVSHAHSDHTSGVSQSKETLSSSVTAELIELRKGIRVRAVGDISGTRLLNAGHILGSRQLLAESDSGYSFLYTGDYQMRESLVAERIEVGSADVLIIDSTFPYKDLVFDDKNEVITAMQHYMLDKVRKGVVLFGVYQLGKAQEIIKIANEVGIAPAVGQGIARVNEIYKRNGVGLDYIPQAEGGQEFGAEAGHNFVGIVEVHRLQEAAYGISTHNRARVFTAVATGFAKLFRMNVSVQFPLSDHADFKQATEYIDQCSPKVVYTYGNKASQARFAEALASEGYNAHPFYENNGSHGLEVKAEIRLRTGQDRPL